MMIRRFVALLVAATSLALPGLCLAQSERGNITGVVEDSTKAGVPGVSVKVINTATNATINLVTSEGGNYNAANLPPGTYRVEASIEGFQSSTVDGIRVTAGATARIDVKLNLGAMSESVSVVADNKQMQTNDAKVSTNISNELIDQLPLVVGGAMRSVFDLVSTIPEAKGTGGNVVLGGGQGGAFGATLDGISVNTNRNANTVETAFLTPSVEAITEFSVETNGFKPEFGQAGGGGITFASKSGTNQFQGSIYNFLRNDALDSKSFFETKKGVYRQNNFGASWGGPVKLPGYNGTNRTFFFASYEGFVNRSGSNANQLSVPTAEMYNGDFSNWVDSQGRMIVIYDPATTRLNPNGSGGFIRDPFPGNKIPVDRFSTLAKQYLAMAAKTPFVPNNGGAPGTLAYVQNNYQSPGGTSQETTYKYSLKIDHSLSNAQRVAYLFNRSNNLSKPSAGGAVGLPIPFNSTQWSSNDADLHRVSWDSISATMVNHFNFGVNTFFNDGGSLNVGGNWKNIVCIQNAVDCNINMSQIGFSEYAGWGGSANNGTFQPRWSIKDDITFVRKKHTFKAGMTFDRQQANGFGQQSIAGQAGFSFLQTGVPGGTSLANAGGNSFASFLLGVANSGSTETIRRVRQIYPYWSFYGQDDWNIGSKLVVNYGLRYEFTSPPREGSDQYTDMSPTTPNPKVNGYPGALIFAGEGPGRTGSRTLIPSYKGAISPRASMAFTPNDKTVLRAGAGRSFGRVTVLGGSSHYNGHIGNYSFASPDAGISPAFLLDQGLPAYPLPPNLDPAFDNNANTDWWNGKEATRPAVYDSWTFSVQRQLRPGMTVEVDYNGSYGSHLQSGLLNPNQVPFAVVDELISRLGVVATTTLLNAQITSPAAVAAGIKVPYPAFTTSAQTSKTVAQALRPFPQYLNINVQNGGGDKMGKSHYHAGVLKFNQRFSGGVTIQSSYTYSHIMTNADSFSGSGRSLDAARPELEWSIGAFDIPHAIKVNTVFELPFGEGRRWLKSGIASQVVGGWRIAVIQSYSAGTPIGVSSNAVLNVFAAASRPNVTGESWRAPIAGKEFDPKVDKFLNPAAFVLPVGTIGNAPRTNGDVRRFWNKSENVSLAKTIKATSSLKMDVRVEAFNLFNRVIWGAPVTNFSSTTFGQITSQANSARQLQLGFKMYW
jgi:carboxypeptidase family protein